MALDHSVNLREAASYHHIGTHLLRCGIPVPEIAAFEDDRFFILEDLGDEDLYRYRHKSAEIEGDVMDLYREALDVLVGLRLRATKSFRSEWCLEESVYTGDFAYRRESCYFLDCFVGEYMGLRVSGDTRKELKDIASRIDAVPTDTLIHRDYQSRNLMVRGDRCFVIDFQGARFGPGLYDAASLLYDPYVRLPRSVRETLLDYHLAALCGPKSERVFPLRTEFHLLAFHRLMQALGAFAFLGLRKGKQGFLEHVPAALVHLAEVWHDIGIRGYPGVDHLIRELGDDGVVGSKGGVEPSIR